MISEKPGAVARREPGTRRGPERPWPLCGRHRFEISILKPFFPIVIIHMQTCLSPHAFSFFYTLFCVLTRMAFPHRDLLSRGNGVKEFCNFRIKAINKLIDWDTRKGGSGRQAARMNNSLVLLVVYCFVISLFVVVQKVLWKKTQKLSDSDVSHHNVRNLQTCGENWFHSVPFIVCVLCHMLDQ